MIPRKSGFNQRYLPESYRTFRSPTNPCGGGGGTPYPPYHLFFRRGSPPHPCAGPSGGHPLSTHGPDRLHSSLPGLWHDRTFTTEIPCGQSSVSRARTTRIPHIAVGGWGSPPSPSFFQKGGHPTPHVSGQVGGTPSQYCKKDALKTVSLKVSLSPKIHALFFFPFPFFTGLSNNSRTILIAHRSPHIEQVSVSPSRTWIAFA